MYEVEGQLGLIQTGLCACVFVYVSLSLNVLYFLFCKLWVSINIFLMFFTVVLKVIIPCFSLRMPKD